MDRHSLYLYGFSLIIVQPEGVATGISQQSEGGGGKNDTKQSHPVASFSVAASFIAPDKCVSNGRFVAVLCPRVCTAPSFRTDPEIAVESKPKGEGEEAGIEIAGDLLFSADFRRGFPETADLKNGGENRGG